MSSSVNILFGFSPPRMPNSLPKKDGPLTSICFGKPLEHTTSYMVSFSTKPNLSGFISSNGLTTVIFHLTSLKSDPVPFVTLSFDSPEVKEKIDWS